MRRRMMAMMMLFCGTSRRAGRPANARRCVDSNSGEDSGKDAAITLAQRRAVDATSRGLVGLAAVSTLLLAGCSDRPTNPALTAPPLSASQAALTFTTIDAPGASYTSASGINDARQIV